MCVCVCVCVRCLYLTSLSLSLLPIFRRVARALEDVILPMETISEEVEKDVTCFVYTERDYLVECLQKIRRDCPSLFRQKQRFCDEIMCAFDECVVQET